MPAAASGSLLRERAPAFAAELEALLAGAGEPDLAASVPGLRIVQPCTCGDDFCASFYTAPPPDGAYGPGYRTVVLAPRHGAVSVHVADGRIAHVEVLHRDELRDAFARMAGRVLSPEAEADVRAKTRDYLRTRGTLLAAPLVAERVRGAVRSCDAFFATVPADRALAVAEPGEWTLNEIADHLVETHRAALDELRCLLAHRRPPSPPVPASLQSRAPLLRPWAWLVEELGRVHQDIVTLLASVPPDFTTDARAEVVMVVNASGEGERPVTVEWVEELDWKAYAIVTRLHILDHVKQAKKVLAAGSAS
ncbi:MAG TPA: hypothetical protein VGL09_08750 [Methylomirabilota bacterium]